ncbi:MAG: hypothetical protein D6712_13685 [Chloroflexi bacterium]|nr:MAG: hypothetical protein D6712_13685 [Chloroflexota bacterium]
MTTLPRVDSEDLTAYFDDATSIAQVIYRGPMTASLTIRAYQWIAQITGVIGVEAIHGAVFDFRAVTNFESYTLSTVMRESKKANMKFDFSHVPVALLVGSGLQEQMVRVALKVSPQDFRKRLVRSQEEALAFIDEWHGQNAPSG